MPGQRPSVGVGVIICRNDTVLIGKRLSDHGKGVRSFPGGHLEYGESLEECARRETAEEAGVEISKVHFADVTNDIFEDSGKHYVTIFLHAHYRAGEACVLEPNKRESRQRTAREKLPRPLFLPIQHLLEQGYSPFN